MKKIIALFLSLVCIFGVIGCSTANTITFYSEPTLEHTDPVSEVSAALSRKQTREIKKIIHNITDWVDDDTVKRPPYYFDGEFMLSGSEYVYYFSYEHNIVFYHHYFAVISPEEMQLIKDIGAKGSL